MNSYKYRDIFATPYFVGSARYDPDENRIYLVGAFQGKGTHEECKDNLRKLKGAFASLTWNENKNIAAAWKVLDNLFSHAAGYKNKKRPDDVGKQLIHITHIEAHAFMKQPNGTLKKAVECRSTFKTSEISTISE